MNRQAIYSALTDIFNDVFMRDDIVLTAETSAIDIEGWDSFKMIEIVMAVEERVKIKLRTQDVENLRNINDLVEVIELKVRR